MKRPKTVKVKCGKFDGLPYITLIGYWLITYGFESGVVVTLLPQAEGKLILQGFAHTSFNDCLRAYVTNRPMRHRYITQLTLSGDQLTNNGFNTGDVLEIAVTWGFITLKRKF